jgi:hypothetical protein
VINPVFNLPGERALLLTRLPELRRSCFSLRCADEGIVLIDDDGIPALDQQTIASPLD